MSSYDKVVKLACKPKAAPPKSKYLDPIIAATWSEDGAVHDVCKALSPRFREPNAIVVFKALIVLHTMIRNGATDNVLGYLSSSETLRLRNVSASNWEGYNAPQNLQNYATYLDSRIRAYHDLKHDAVRVQAESNRDMRNNDAMEETQRQLSGEDRGGKSSAAPFRSKTIMGRKLRVMAVEKGLLRETKAVQKMIDALVECRFYLDDLEDELTTTALRMLVKDLLILFQAVNEGVINVLEHYFEMSFIDAKQALAIYRLFCKQAERVVEYLGVAKKLQNLLNVPVPNLKHAPVSLAGALQEYLDDSNFEQNRIEYKTNKEAAERNAKMSKGDSSNAKKNERSQSTTSTSSTALKPTTSPIPTTTTATKPDATRNMVDFFSAIEEEQPTMFNPQTNSPTDTYFQQQAASNPFVLWQAATGATQPFAMPPQVQIQPTGFLAPQQTNFQQPPPNPFARQVSQQQQPGHRPFSSFLKPQATAFMQQPTGGGFLQPQATGSNPFRQSMMFPQTTGMPSFGSGMHQQGSGQTFSPSSGASSVASSAFLSPLSTFSPSPSVASPPPQSTSAAANLNVPARPASTPLTSFTSSSQQLHTSPPIAQPVKTHQTGTKNPFGPVITPPPPVPKQPTLMELTMGLGTGANPPNVNDVQNNQQQQQPFQPSGSFGALHGYGGPGSQGGTDMASIASSFSFFNKNGSADKPGISGFSSTLNGQKTSTATGSTFSSSLSTQPTGAMTTSASSVPSTSMAGPLQPQTTGFAPLKAFKPSSSFGASLLESLPPIPGTTPTGTSNNSSTHMSAGLPSQPPGLGTQRTGFGVSNTQPTGFGGVGTGASSGLVGGLRPQMTGGAANPFRISMMATAGAPNFGGGPQPPHKSSTLPPFGSSMGAPSQNPTAVSFGSSLFGAGTGGASSFNAGGYDASKQQQQQHQNGSASLI